MLSVHIVGQNLQDELQQLEESTKQMIKEKKEQLDNVRLRETENKDKMSELRKKVSVSNGHFELSH